jgi:hypothetical protein
MDVGELKLDGRVAPFLSRERATLPSMEKRRLSGEFLNGELDFDERVVQITFSTQNDLAADPGDGVGMGLNPCSKRVIGLVWITHIVALHSF